MDQLYRYVDIKYADYDFGPSTDVRLHTFRITKTTAKGVWIDNHGKKKFVLLHGKKRFAYPTEEEALTSFIARKEMQQVILESQLKHVGNALRIAEHKKGQEYGIQKNIKSI